ncbi:glucuronate isomerase [Shigella flexneri]
MTEDFPSDTEFACRLYHDYGKDQPIFDYHCHSPPQDIRKTIGSKTCMTSGEGRSLTNGGAPRTNGVADVVHR